MKLFPVALICLATLAGCAFGTRKVNLLYGDRVTTKVADPRGDARVAVARFRDGRPSGESGQRLGWIRDTYGIPTATVVARQDPVLWVSDGVARALESRGYRVERVDSPNSAGSLPTITGVVTRVYSGMYSNIDAHVEVSVTLVRNGENISSTNCNGTIVAPAGTISASEYEAVFTATMDQFITDCIPRLIEPLEEATDK